MVGIATGGNPSSTGVYYDDIWNNDLLPAGTTNCTNAKTGVEVTWTENIDKITANAGTTRTLDAGQGLSGLPGSILSMTGNPRTLMNTTKLPVTYFKQSKINYFGIYFLHRRIDFSKSHTPTRKFSDGRLILQHANPCTHTNI